MKNRINKCVVCSNKEITLLFAHHGRDMGRCRHCKLVQLVSMPSKTEIAKLYHEDFDHFAPYLEQIEVHREYFRRVLAVILAKARIGIGIQKTKTDSRVPARNASQRVAGGRGNDKRLRLLDIGCAMGALLEEAQKQGMEAVGIDISKDAVAFCRKKGLTVHEGTVTRFKRSHLLKLNGFDVVTVFQVIEHERDPLAFVRRIHSLLKKGGMVVLATPNHGGFWRKVMGRRWFGFAHPEHVVLLDFASMRFLLEKAGFADIEIRKDSPRPFPLSFALRRAADYFPAFRWILIPLGKLFDRFHIRNPINPWNDMIVYAMK